MSTWCTGDGVTIRYGLLIGLKTAHARCVIMHRSTSEYPGAYNRRHEHIYERIQHPDVPVPECESRIDVGFSEEGKRRRQDNTHNTNRTNRTRFMHLTHFHTRT